jgi:intein/homing endonuclease
MAKSNDPNKKHQQLIMALGPLSEEALQKNGLELMSNSAGGPLSYAVKQATGSAKRNKTVPRLAFTEDPYNTTQFGGIYRNKTQLLPDYLKKSIRAQNSLVASILRARGNHLSLSGHIRRDRFDVGLEVMLKPEFASIIKAEQMAKIKQRISKTENILVNCGYNEGLDRKDKMSLPRYLSIQASNGLTFGWFGTEIVWERDDQGNKIFNRFRPVDAGTIYYPTRKDETEHEAIRRSALNALKELKHIKLNIDLESLENDKYTFIQVITGIPRQAFTDDELLMTKIYENTDIELNDYPIGPMESALTAITTHMSIGTYNKLFFQNGRAAKGMLVIKSNEIDQATVDSMKNEFFSSINGVNNAFRVPIFAVDPEDSVAWEPMASASNEGEYQFLYDQVARDILASFNMSPDELPSYGHLSRGSNQQTLCLDRSSKIYTPEGHKTIDDILLDKEEVFTEVWTGKKWEKAKVFTTDIRKQVLTTLTNGTEIITSPDHRFKVVGENGDAVWKSQKDLTTEDYVLVNKNSVKGFENIPEFKGKKLTVEMMEVLGWLIGDGTIFARYNKNTKNLKQGTCLWFYHAEKERFLWEKHNKILNEFGLSPKHKEKIRNADEIEKIKNRCQWKTVKETKITNELNNNDFLKFLFSLGFTTSTEGKQIPELIHTLPEEYRCSFLRAFFSADGTLAHNSRPKIIIHDNLLRKQTKELLLGLGIRVQKSEGKFKFAPQYRGGEKIPAQTCLVVKDKDIFFEKIGFLQDHKQPDPEDLVCKRTKGPIPHSLALKFIPLILEKGKNCLKKCDKNNLITILNQTSERFLTIDRFLRYLEQVKIEIPEWLKNFHIEKIDKIVDLDSEIEMADIEIFDDEHAFIANGMVVHNSESSNEFKLTAARDTGIRPLLMRFQSFFNEDLFPIIDPELSRICTIKFAGLDAETREQEAIRLGQEAPLYYTYDEVLSEVEKDKLGSHLGGNLPFNQNWNVVFDKYGKVSDVIAELLDNPVALLDRSLDFIRDPFYFQHITLLSQANPTLFQAKFAYRPYENDLLKMWVKDYVEDEDN